MVHKEETYEYIWIVIVAAVIAGLSVVMAYYGFALNLNPVCNATPIDIKEVEKLTPGVKEIGPGIYEITMIGQQFSWNPNRIVLKDPKRVIFKITSKDVIHGFQIVGTSVNAMVFPGYIGQFIWEPPNNFEGRFLIICNEYCGVGHHLMYATLEIER